MQINNNVMEKGWIKKTFDDCIDKVKVKTKLPSSAYCKDGKYPIISQEKELISGYWDCADDVISTAHPVTIFGDHTMVAKYINFDFVVGADGVKILQPKTFLNPRFFYYWVCSVNIPSRGYARHYRYLRERNVEYPSSLDEQKRIVEILDKEFEKIDTLKANAEKGLQYAKKLFQSALKQELLPKEGWMIKSLDMISTFSQGVQVEVGKQFTEKLDGYMRFLRIVDFTQGNEPPRYVDIIDERYQVKKDSLSVVRYGASAGFICTGQEGVIANNIFKIELKRDTLISNAYLYYVLISDIFQSVIRENVNGAAMPAISFGMIKDVNIPYPSIQEQNQIVAHLDKLKAHCNNLQKNYEKTIALCDNMKQTLLRKAFNGEL